MTPAVVRTRVQLPLRLPDGFECDADVMSFEGLADAGEHLALALGEPGTVPLVRVHSECLTGDVLGSRRCDCGPQLRESLERVEAAGGYLLYLRQEGRGIGLYAKLDAYALQDEGLDTYDANLALGFAEDERDYTVAAQMLQALGVGALVLLGNNPDKAQQLCRLGITVTEQARTGVHLSQANARYLSTKRDHTAHMLDLSVAG